MNKNRRKKSIICKKCNFENKKTILDCENCSRCLNIFTYIVNNIDESLSYIIYLMTFEKIMFNLLLIDFDETIAFNMDTITKINKYEPNFYDMNNIMKNIILKKIGSYNVIKNIPNLFSLFKNEQIFIVSRGLNYHRDGIVNILSETKKSLNVIKYIGDNNRQKNKLDLFFEKNPKYLNKDITLVFMDDNVFEHLSIIEKYKVYPRIKMYCFLINWKNIKSYDKEIQEKIKEFQKI